MAVGVVTVGTASPSLPCLWVCGDAGRCVWLFLLHMLAVLCVLLSRLSSSLRLRVGCSLSSPRVQVVYPVPVNSKAALDALLSFSTPIGTNYTGVWQTAGGTSELVITIIAAVPNAAAAAYRTATRVGGTMSVSVLAAANLQVPRLWMLCPLPSSRGSFGQIWL